jgi:hypothetical protein
MSCTYFFHHILKTLGLNHVLSDLTLVAWSEKDPKLNHLDQNHIDEGHLLETLFTEIDTSLPEDLEIMGIECTHHPMPTEESYFRYKWIIMELLQGWRWAMPRQKKNPNAPIAKKVHILSLCCPKSSCSATFRCQFGRLGEKLTNPRMKKHTCLDPPKVQMHDDFFAVSNWFNDTHEFNCMMMVLLYFLVTDSSPTYAVRMKSEIRVSSKRLHDVMDYYLDYYSLRHLHPDTSKKGAKLDWFRNIYRAVKRILQKGVAFQQLTIQKRHHPNLVAYHLWLMFLSQPRQVTIIFKGKRERDESQPLAAHIVVRDNSVPMAVGGQWHNSMEDPISIFGNFLNNTLPSHFRPTDAKFFQLAWKIWNDEMGTSKKYENRPDIRDETVPDPPFTKENVEEGFVSEYCCTKELTLRSLGRCRDKIYLGSVILDGMMEMIVANRREELRDVLYISSLGHASQYEEAKNEWKVSRKKKLNIQKRPCLEETKPLVIFGFNPSRIHWKFVEADPLQNTIVHWCSTQDQYSNTTSETRSVIAYFKAYALRPDTNREWKIHLSNEDHCSRQPDSYNCGVFYLLHCFFVLNGYREYANRLNELDLKKVRLWICYCLVKGEFIDPLRVYTT